MITELFVENYRLDISGDISTLLNFAIDDIKDFSSRSTTWSKTVILPGTQNNNKLFGHIFNIGQSNNVNDLSDNVGYNFNATKAADCIIFQDQMQTFKGILRLMQINIIKGQIEYEVSLFGEMSGLNVALSGSLLEELDFSAYDHVYSAANVSGSWVNTLGTGVYYPLIDYGTYSDVTKHDWDIRTFRPALHVREYIDKMITDAGYRWESDLFDTARFKTLIVPHNKNKFYTRPTDYLDVEASTMQTIVFLSASYLVNFATTILNTAFTATGTNTFNYDDPTTINPTITVTLSGTVTGNLTASLMRLRGAGPATILGTAAVAGVGLAAYSVSISVMAELQQNDDIYVCFSGFLPITDAVTINTGSRLFVEAGATIGVEIAVGGTVEVNNNIPKNVRQIDFLLGVVKLFNLYVYESLNDSRKIFFKPYVDFYSTDSTDSVDWTYKMNRDKALKIKPMSELNAKKYEFRYKPDSDFYNEAYRKRYGQGYGDYVFDSNYEFSAQAESFEILFSATPLVGYNGEEKVYSTIFKQSNDVEEKIDSNIRILQSKKITGVTSWDMLDGVTLLGSFTVYGYAGHFDDPDAVSNDLNFGALRELFFELVSGDLTVTQFNLYWSAYMAEITDKDSKLLIAFFKLNPVDILQLDFSKKVFIDGNLFRLNSIKDYNVSRPEDCEVELLKVNYLIY